MDLMQMYESILYELKSVGKIHDATYINFCDAGINLWLAGHKDNDILISCTDPEIHIISTIMNIAAHNGDKEKWMENFKKIINLDLDAIDYLNIIDTLMILAKNGYINFAFNMINKLPNCEDKPHQEQKKKNPNYFQILGWTKLASVAYQKNNTDILSEVEQALLEYLNNEINENISEKVKNTMWKKDEDTYILDKLSLALGTLITIYKLTNKEIPANLKNIVRNIDSVLGELPEEVSDKIYILRDFAALKYAMGMVRDLPNFLKRKQNKIGLINTMWILERDTYLESLLTSSEKSLYIESIFTAQCFWLGNVNEEIFDIYFLELLPNYSHFDRRNKLNYFINNLINRCENKEKANNLIKRYMESIPDENNPIEYAYLAKIWSICGNHKQSKNFIKKALDPALIEKMPPDWRIKIKKDVIEAALWSNDLNFAQQILEDTFNKEFKGLHVKEYPSPLASDYIDLLHTLSKIILSKKDINLFKAKYSPRV